MQNEQGRWPSSVFVRQSFQTTGFRDANFVTCRLISATALRHAFEYGSKEYSVCPVSRSVGIKFGLWRVIPVPRP